MDGHSKNCIFRSNKPETKCFEFLPKRWNIWCGSRAERQNLNAKITVYQPAKIKKWHFSSEIKTPFQIPANWSSDLRFVDKTNFESLQPTLRQNKTWKVVSQEYKPSCYVNWLNMSRDTYKVHCKKVLLNCDGLLPVV